MKSVKVRGIELAQAYVYEFLLGQNHSVIDDIFDEHVLSVSSLGIGEGRDICRNNAKPWVDAFKINKIIHLDETFKDYYCEYDLKFTSSHIGDFKSIAATGIEIERVLSATVCEQINYF